MSRSKTETLSFAVDDDLREAIERRAIEQSEPGNRVTISKVVRDALRDEFCDEESPDE